MLMRVRWRTGVNVFLSKPLTDVWQLEFRRDSLDSYKIYMKINR